MKLKKIAVAVGELFGRRATRVGLALSALALALDKAEHAKLPEAQRGLYVEKDGKFTLDVDGLEDTAGLKSALEKERKAAREAERVRKELEKRFEGIDPDEVKKILEKLGSDEERQLLKDGKIDQVVEKRMEKQRAALEKQVKDKQKELDAERDGKAKLVQSTLDERVRAAATKAGLHASAIDDALVHARTIFTLNAENEAVQLDKDGHPVIGKDGKTPFGPAEWLEGKRETAPHWFPAANAGSGALGGKGAGGTGKTMKRATFDALSPEQKRNFTVVEKGTVVD